MNNPEYQELLNQYQDRKKMKWAGFYLSDHAAKINEEKKARDFTWPAKKRMSLAEIDEVLYTAVLKSSHVAIQKEETDLNGRYSADITGLIKGYDELGVFIEEEKVHYDEIRHAELVDFVKWSELLVENKPGDS